MVWQKAMDLCESVYKESRKFPKDEIFGLTSQFRRASTSILLNISEGSACRTKREFSHFLNIVLRSQYETVAVIKLSRKLNVLDDTSYTKLNNLSEEIGKMLHGLSNSLNKSNN